MEPETVNLPKITSAGWSDSIPSHEFRTNFHPETGWWINKLPRVLKRERVMKQKYWLVVSVSTPLKNMFVKMGSSSPNFRGWKFQNIWVATTQKKNIHPKKINNFWTPKSRSFFLSNGGWFLTKVPAVNFHSKEHTTTRASARKLPNFIQRIEFWHAKKKQAGTIVLLFSTRWDWCYNLLYPVKKNGTVLGPCHIFGIISERCSTGLHSTNKHGPSGQKMRIFKFTNLCFGFVLS